MTVATKSRSAARAGGRSGRPPRDQAGEVDQRILDAAQQVFLEHGLEGSSVDQIAETAHAGKPTIYARFPHKEALFVAVMERMVQRRMETVAANKLSAAAGTTISERLKIFARLTLRTALVEETIALMRAAIAEARRFPELASSVHRLLRVRGEGEIGQLFAELAAIDLPEAPALEPERRSALARRFIELTLLPLMMRGLFGEPLAQLRNEIDAHVDEAVDFFVAGHRCR